MNPKISIIVPVYNVEPYLHKCIDSILNQTFKDFELILVDDGSPDNCGNICNVYAKKDSRIVVIHTENRGVSNARNKGIEIARGDFIGFVDSDDYLESNMYKELYQSCIDNDSDISIIGFTGVNDYEKVLFKYIPNKECYRLSNILKTANPFNKLYRKSLFLDEKIRFKLNRYYEDLNLIPKLIIKANKISYVSKCTYNYLQREGSTTHSKDEKILDNIWAYVDIKEYLQEERLYNHYEEEFVIGVNYFKHFYANVLYTYPFSFILKNKKIILNYFNQITTISIWEIIVFVLKYMKINTIYKKVYKKY